MPEPTPQIDIQKLAERVYKLMLNDARVQGARGQARSRKNKYAK
jgi:hypothetical protein